jgi:predicted regulator of Ras-like GTPase activity (Roadblock/LC7/MglB family)
MNSELKGRLERIVNDLAKTDGVEGSLIVDGNGEVLANHILQDVDIKLFGPMANVITGSSKRLINFSNHGEIERVLVESKNGKALFLHLGNVHFIVLMKNKANVGMVMLSSKRASQDIMDLTKDMTPIQLEEQVAQSKEEPEITPEPVESEAEITIVPEEATIPEEKIAVVSEEKDTVEVEASKSAAETEEITKTATSDISKTSSELDTASGEVIASEEVAIVESEELVEEPAVEEESGAIPVIKPPISFPKLMKITEIPEDEEKRLDLLLKIYESIFLAMSIGASKIMGVAPARGLTRKFLPVEECRKLLDGVDVKNNSTIDFVKIRENAEKIPVSEREESFKENFGKIIAVITENYGKVMGYSAFRAMIRPEFKIINESYGHLLDELGIKEQLHPELRDFFN